eukprot:tig00021013_g17049.t1
MDIPDARLLFSDDSSPPLPPSLFSSLFPPRRHIRTYILADSPADYHFLRCQADLVDYVDASETTNTHLVLDLVPLASARLERAFTAAETVIWNRCIRLPKDHALFPSDEHLTIVSDCDILRAYSAFLEALGRRDITHSISFQCCSPPNPIFLQPLPEDAPDVDYPDPGPTRKLALDYYLAHPRGSGPTWHFYPTSLCKPAVPADRDTPLPAWYWDEDLTLAPTSQTEAGTPLVAYHRCDPGMWGVPISSLIAEQWARGPALSCPHCHPTPAPPGPPPTFPFRDQTGALPVLFERYGRRAIPYSAAIDPDGPRYDRRVLPLLDGIKSRLAALKAAPLSLIDPNPRSGAHLATPVLLAQPIPAEPVDAFFRLLQNRQVSFRLHAPTTPKCLFLSSSHATSILMGTAPTALSLKARAGQPHLDRPYVPHPFSPTEYDYILLPLPPSGSRPWRLAIISARLREIRILDVTRKPASDVTAPLNDWVISWWTATLRPGDPSPRSAWKYDTSTFPTQAWKNVHTGEDALFVMTAAEFIGRGEEVHLYGKGRGRPIPFHAPIYRERWAAALLLRDPEVLLGTVQANDPAFTTKRQRMTPRTSSRPSQHTAAKARRPVRRKRDPTPPPSVLPSPPVPYTGNPRPNPAHPTEFPSLAP